LISASTASLTRWLCPLGTTSTDRSVAVDHYDIAGHSVGVCILVGDRMHRLPAADVGPAHVDRHNGDARTLFHHGMVD
jgi:hypothetical protein